MTWEAAEAGFREQVFSDPLLFRSILLSLHVFVICTVFSPFSFISNLIALWSEKMPDMISIFLNLARLSLRPNIVVSLRKCYMCT